VTPLGTLSSKNLSAENCGPEKMKTFIRWLLRPLFRYRVKKLEGFAGPESYTNQMKRRRLIASLKACLMF
jgi:hypothetical protein